MRSILVFTALFLSAPILAVPTTVTVRAISRDAKVIGTHVGGARITIREAATGRVLAQGEQLGGTGDTERLVKEPRARYGGAYAAAGTASFVATIDLERPTVVEISAEGPLKYPQALGKASKTLLLVPGQHVIGEGVLLEIHGFILTIEEAAAERVRVRMAMT